MTLLQCSGNTSVNISNVYENDISQLVIVVLIRRD